MTLKRRVEKVEAKLGVSGDDQNREIGRIVALLRVCVCRAEHALSLDPEDRSFQELAERSRRRLQELGYAPTDGATAERDWERLQPIKPPADLAERLKDARLSLKARETEKTDRGRDGNQGQIGQD
jgi:hypothetical protein